MRHHIMVVRILKREFHVGNSTAGVAWDSVVVLSNRYDGCEKYGSHEQREQNNGCQNFPNRP